MLEEKGGIPVTGVVPYMHLVLEDEDSLSDRFAEHEEKAVDIAVIRFPRISNFTDFMVFESIEGVSVRYVDTLEKLHHPDMIILPGSKNTMDDLKMDAPERAGGCHQKACAKSGCRDLWHLRRISDVGRVHHRSLWC